MIENLNPKIRTIKIGKKSLEEIEVYPLSIADQFKLSDILGETFQFVATSANSKGDIQFVGFIIGVIQRNLGRILELSTSEKPAGESWWNKIARFFRGRPEPHILSKTTNDQAFEIAQAIYEMNYAEILKKVNSLRKGESHVPEPLRRLWQSFFGDTRNTGSTTSTEENPGVTEA